MFNVPNFTSYSFSTVIPNGVREVRDLSSIDQERSLAALGMTVFRHGLALGDESANQRMLTARAASSAMMVREISDCSIVPSLAQRDRTAVSVGENAVLVLKARNR